MAKPLIEITTTDKQFQRAFNKALKVQVVSYMNKVAVSAEKPIKDILRKNLKNHRVVESVASGELRGHFGLVHSTARISDIIDFWVDGLEIKVGRTTVSSSVVSSHFEVRAIRSSYRDVLQLSESAFKITTNEGKPYTIDWLRWLLLKGDSTINKEYEVDFSNNARISVASRTAQAVMKKGGRWGVPPQFAGTQENNFATQAVYMSIVQINNTLKAIMDKTTA